MPVNEMLDRMPSHELTEWMAFNSLEPIGEQRMDVRFAHLATVVANYTQPKARRKLTDFLLWMDKDDSPEALLDKFSGLMEAAFGGNDGDAEPIDS